MTLPELDANSTTAFQLRFKFQFDCLLKIATALAQFIRCKRLFDRAGGG